MDGTAEVTKELAYGSGNMSLLYGARRDSRLSLDMGGSAINPSDLKGEIEAIEKDIRCLHSSPAAA